MTGPFILTLQCPGRPGIVHAITSVFVDLGFDITEHQQFDDTIHSQVFIRTVFAATDPGHGLDDFQAAFAPVAAAYDMAWQLRDVGVRTRVLIMVSRFDHCLTDLLYRWRSGTLDADIVGIVSNHPDLNRVADSAGIPFHHIPVTPATKPQAEQELLHLIERHRVDLTVLARYMQVLSDPVCQQLAGRAINIHHSFLPSFAGARPYHQAYERGVKHVGATAHYVTADLDEGPIIEQELIRVDHRRSPEDLVAVGRDAEKLALARAVTWHCQGRVMLNGHRTVVFS